MNPTFFPNRPTRSIRLTALTGALALLACTASAQQMSRLAARGPQIVNAQGQPVVLRGVNVGGWLLQESYILKTDTLDCQRRIQQGLLRTMPEKDVEEFYRQYRAGFVTKADIDFIAKQGFNCVRLPFHYDLFLTQQQRWARTKALQSPKSDAALTAYVQTLSQWYDAGQLFTDLDQLDGIRAIDNVLGWCAADQLYVVLDLHAAPGGQGTDPNINDNFRPLDLWKRRDAKGRLIYQDVTVRLWEQLARRYKNDPRIAMYDLINEPHNLNAEHGLSADNQELSAFYSRLIDAVRAQKDEHLLLLEGNGYGNEYTNLTPDKLRVKDKTGLVYNSHRYWCPNDAQAADPNPNQINLVRNLAAFRDRWQVPVWVGETGENSNEWFAAAVQQLNAQNIGWCHWNLKRVDAGTSFLRVKPYGSILTAEGRAKLLQNSKFENCEVNRDALFALLQPADARQPFARHTLPATIPAAAYDLGRDGVAYHDTYSARIDYREHKPTNTGDQYRNDGVDIQASTEAGAGGYAVAHTEAGEWLSYTVTVPKAGQYALQLRATNSGPAPARLQLKLGEATVGTFTVAADPATTGWQTVAGGTASLPAGTHTLRLLVEQPGAVLGWLRFAETKAAAQGGQ
ncbi:carbohydrate-binding protein [Hymenobacter gummosus]|uniref:Carbohydrate-binding protein n=1 Tax=Hymenobacter gummosus TaxID=1776032 RepID=A0A3S0H5R7_9BACT|nr:cellulase family glycosylhydrolase [Hymenobacter gummosus]RTQ48980.1 carbohydrate-binding protein [Hymenobacter gummosus]